MNAMRQTLWWLAEHRLTPDEMNLKIYDAVKLCSLTDSTREWNELISWPSYLGIEHLGLRIVSRMNEMAYYIHFENVDFRINEEVTQLTTSLLGKGE